MTPSTSAVTKILIVDDEENIRLIFARWFEREGYRVMTAENGRQALEVMENFSCDLIISDVRMPVMDGIELAIRLKQMAVYVPKIVFISGFTDLDVRAQFDLGIVATVGKPVTRQSLLEVARRALADARSKWSAELDCGACDELQSGFAGLAQAQDAGLISFGRGGFCLRSDFATYPDQQVALHLGFTAEERVLAGCGIARWNDGGGSLLGIEITSLQPESLDWVVAYCAGQGSNAFIPAVTADRSS